jgi:Asp-tRNA(Asn)/Glu-tRNA(Gln) amidotransferase A subunit family amidase
MGAELVETELPGRAPVGAVYAAEFAAAWEGLLGDDVSAEVCALLNAGRAGSSVDYLRELDALRRLRRETRLDVDLVATPAVPVPPRRLEEPDDVRLVGRFARLFNVLDWPALVLPSRLQLAGDDRALWVAAAVLEAVTV